MITHLFKQSLATSELLTEWKSVYITPFFKKDKSCDPSNYWQVSLMSILCKKFDSKSDHEAPGNQSNIMSKSVWVQNKILL